MRRIRTYGGYFQAFMQTLDEKVQRKIDYALQLLKTQERLSSKFVKQSEMDCLNCELNTRAISTVYSSFRQWTNRGAVQRLSQKDSENTQTRNRKGTKNKGGLL